jgi:hypothetical protein
MLCGIEKTGTVALLLPEEASAWVAKVLLEMRDLPMLKNAWKKTGYNWFEGEVVEGNADNPDVGNDNDYDRMENLIDDVLGNGNDDDDYNNVSDNNINSKDDGSGGEDSDKEVDDFFPVFKEGAMTTTTD